MTDNLTTEQRRHCMSRVRGRDTGIEWALRRALWARGMRYRVQLRIAGTRPDVIFTRAKVAVFVDGCFWHGCPRHYAAPASNADFWAKKIAANRGRDEKNDHLLENDGWRVLRFTECELRDGLDAVASTVERAVRRT